MMVQRGGPAGAADGMDEAERALEPSTPRGEPDGVLLDARAAARQLLDGEAPSLLLTGAGGCAAALVVRQLVALGAELPVLLCADAERARQLRDDLQFVLGRSDRPRPRVLLLDAPEHSPYAALLPDRRRAHQRLATWLELALQDERAAGERPRALVLTAGALLRRVPPLEQVRRAARLIRVGEPIDREGLLMALVATGYLRVPLVEDPATFAVRGGIVDVWSAGRAQPLRLELDGDAVASLSAFDPQTQRRLERVGSAWLAPARVPPLDASTRGEAAERLRAMCDAVDWPSSSTRRLIEELCAGRSVFGAERYAAAMGDLAAPFGELPGTATVIVDEPDAVARALADGAAKAEADWQACRQEPGCEPASLLCTPAEVEGWLRTRRCLALSRLALAGAPLLGLGADSTPPSLGMDGQQALASALAATRSQQGGGSLAPLVSRIERWQTDDLRVLLSARSHAEADRLVEMLRGRELVVELLPEGEALAALLDPAAASRRTDVTHVTVGTLARGVIAPVERLVLLTEEEIFGARKQRRLTRAPARRSGARLLDDLRSLCVGDHVVHREHGVGRYQGLVHRQVRDHTVDLLAIDYAGGDRLYLPVYRLGQLSKYRGGGAPKLDRLGGQSFARSRKRAARRARILADELLRLYAERRAAAGQRTPPADEDYRLFEAGFPYQETEDQARAIAEVGADLEAAQPMDRLVCGDVGFGKTEVALRAAFRVAMSGRQVAVLCPTTVLAQQHELTFAGRFAGYPITLATLSRFCSPRQIKAAVTGLRQGTVDVVVGTHRLLSKDVHFKRLGLLVIDEEQRFGVGAKERIKALRTDVDVLTLSATPIPRTLQMAVAGLRDLSVMASAPADRRAVRTIVMQRDGQVLREAIARELGRGGQVFFVCGRIEGLAERARWVAGLAPAARIAISHGQMGERQLERTMIDFVRGEIDILCTTAIIENGLDIPRANTIIIDRADRYGLAQLYQLRGRVGRSSERAYCYLVVPDSGRLSDQARLRLEALGRHSELGAGFELAALDLDLRGGGNLLGPEQSGALAAVGVELFCSMVEQAVAELRGQPTVAEIDPELSFDVEALLPESYVADVGLRLSLYKRLAAAEDAEAVTALATEMEDRFGPAPPEARRLVQLMRLKPRLRRLGALGCEASAAAVTLHLGEGAPLDTAALTHLMAASGARYRLSPEMRLSRKSEPGEPLWSGIEACARMLDELEPCLTGG